MVGLSRFQDPPPLLRQIGGKPRPKLEQPVKDVYDRPLSSDDEDDIPEADSLRLVSSRTSRRQSPAEDSEPDEPDRGDMKRTRFPAASAKALRKSSRQASSLRDRKHPADEDTDEASSSSTKRRRLVIDKESAPAKRSPPSSANHLRDECGFTKTRKAKATYGSKARASQESHGSQAKRSQGSQAKKGSAKASGRSTLRDVDDSRLLSSPEKSSKAKFKALPDDTLGTPKKSRKAKLKTAPGSSFDAPEQGTKIKPVPKDEPSPSPSKGGVLRLSQSDDLSQRSYSSQQRKSLWNPRRINKQAQKKAIAPVKLERAQFILPIDMDDAKRDGSSPPPLSDMDSSDTETVNNEPAEEEESPQAKVTECPWCGDLVSEVALKEYTKGKRLNVQVQKGFCRKHKKETAKETWRERGYPHVDWERLEGRFGDHRDYLSRVIDGKRSHYRDILAEKIETGQGRLLKKEGDLNPGYYGPRGCKLMCDYLVEEFGELLMEKAVSDRVIAGRGSAAFIQSVLVAELAVQLIMEDMDVSAAEAREIMEESKAVGEMIHEEV